METGMETATRSTENIQCTTSTPKMPLMMSGHLLYHRYEAHGSEPLVDEMTTIVDILSAGIVVLAAGVAGSPVASYSRFSFSF
jgi:hypothetical protein